MSSDDERARLKASYSAVGRILWEVWDPIGARYMGFPPDEYDSYIAEVVRLLQGGADEVALSSYLRQLAEDRMGMGGRDTEEEAARALLALNLR